MEHVDEVEVEFPKDTVVAAVVVKRGAGRFDVKLGVVSKMNNFIVEKVGSQREEGK